jgi:hypothetical protein
MAAPDRKSLSPRGQKEFDELAPSGPGMSVMRRARRRRREVRPAEPPEARPQAAILGGDAETGAALGAVVGSSRRAAAQPQLSILPQ